MTVSYGRPYNYVEYAAYTIAGGLTAVVWTDFVQTALMVAGAFVFMVLGEWAWVGVGVGAEMVSEWVRMC